MIKLNQFKIFQIVKKHPIYKYIENMNFFIFIVFFNTFGVMFIWMWINADNKIPTDLEIISGKVNYSSCKYALNDNSRSMTFSLEGSNDKYYYSSILPNSQKLKRMLKKSKTIQIKVSKKIVWSIIIDEKIVLSTKSALESTNRNDKLGFWFGFVCFLIGFLFIFWEWLEIR